MTEQELDTCHCIIGHPSKAKFLAVRHVQGWSPPELHFQPGNVDFKPKMLNEGMMRKYGLKTKVLRRLQHLPKYHCIEMVLIDSTPTKKLDAVWVDREQYEKFRNQIDDMPDPFDTWLTEQESGVIPALRSPWMVRGWFERAETWVQYQLELMGVQVKGSIAQYRVGWNASTLLSIPTNQGKYYFKAAYSKPPGEAKITLALAEKWPEAIIRPGAFDLKENWLLNRDFTEEGEFVSKIDQYPECVKTLARIQIESTASIADWEALGCPRHDFSHLLSLIENQENLMPWLHYGGVKLDEGELHQFRSLLADNVTLINQLQEFSIPDTLVHLDIRCDNLVLQNGQCKIIDWSDVVIGHPFRSLLKLYSERELLRVGVEDGANLNEAENGVLKEMTESYLESFVQYESMSKLKEALALARKLENLWRINETLFELVWVEKESPSYIKLVLELQFIARKINDQAK